MDISVDPELKNIAKVLESVRSLIKDHILPRLTDLEVEVRLLRRVTWPVCQGIHETTQLNDMQSKRDFLCDLDPDEVRLLLKLKSKGLFSEEFHQLNLPVLPPKTR